MIILAIFLVILPWVQGLHSGINNEVIVDGITTSAIVVMIITLIISLMSWGLLSWASKNISFSGILLGIISGASLIIPFLNILGPMAGVIVGVIAGFVAFMLQKKMLNPAKNQPLIIAIIILATTYSILFTVFLTTQSSTIWDTDVGIGAWTGTTEGLERPSFASILLHHTEIIFIPIVIVSMIMTGLIIRGERK
ncbi:hypothetical protein DSQ20_04680 [Nitrosarchaeum sp. AC2]|nr:hypothetical protein DSQ20_04680 [Nitrosarchaeum sp. AC2]